MATRLYLHIGHIHGSSSHIGKLLAANRETLRTRGYGICDASLTLAGDVGSAAFFEPYLTGEARDAAGIDAAFRNLQALAASQKLNAVIVHAPNLARPGGAALVATARQYFDVTIVYYFKRQEELVFEWWMSGIYKTGLGLNGYVENLLAHHPRRYYRDTLEEYLEIFGRDAMRVQLLWFKVLAGGKLELDLWHALALDHEGLEAVEESAPLVSGDLAMALKESPYLFENEGDEELTDFIRAQAIGEATGKANPLDIEVRSRIMKHFQPENRWIRETFFEGVAMEGWNAVSPADERNHDVTLGGITEAINLNLAMLKELSEDIERIKKKMGLR